MLRLLVIILLGFIIYQIIKRPTVIKRPMPKRSTNRRASQVTELVRDPICKTYLAKDRALVHEDHYFCSLECRDKFMAHNPKKS